MQLFKIFIILFVSFFINSIAINAQGDGNGHTHQGYFGEGIESVDAIYDTHDIIDVIWVEKLKMAYWYPLIDVNGEAIMNYTVIKRESNNTTEYDVSTGNAIYDNEGNLKFLIPNITCEDAECIKVLPRTTDTDVLTVITPLPPPAQKASKLFSNSEELFNVFPTLIFLIGNRLYGSCENISQNYSNYECCNTAKECLELIAVNHNILVQKIDLEAFGDDTNCNFSDTPTSFIKDGYYISEIVFDTYYLNKSVTQNTFNNNIQSKKIQNFQYSKLSVNSNALSADKLFFHYRVQVSYIHTSAPNDTIYYPSNMTDICNYKTLNFSKPLERNSRKTSNEFIENTFNIFPNPCRNYSTITYTLAAETEVYIEIYDALGRKMIDKKEYQLAGECRTEINTSDLPIGTYICRISQSNGEVSSQRFVKIE